ncbi:tyrosine-type recombinase/integrase [Nonomuraea wenchangensis]
MPKRCVEALIAHREQQRKDMKEAGEKRKDHGLVFASLVGTPLDAHNVRRAFRKIVKDAGMPAYYWTPREMRHSFVSLLSDSGVPLEDIARLVGHSGTPSPKPSTVSRSARYSCKELRRWTPSSPGSHSPMRKGATLESDTLIDQRKPGRDDRI